MCATTTDRYAASMFRKVARVASDDGRRVRVTLDHIQDAMVRVLPKSWRSADAMSWGGVEGDCCEAVKALGYADDDGDYVKK